MKPKKFPRDPNHQKNTRSAGRQPKTKPRTQKKKKRKKQSVFDQVSENRGRQEKPSVTVEGQKGTKEQHRLCQKGEEVRYLELKKKKVRAQCSDIGGGVALGGRIMAAEACTSPSLKKTKQRKKGKQGPGKERLARTKINAINLEQFECCYTGEKRTKNVPNLSGKYL